MRWTLLVGAATMALAVAGCGTNRDDRIGGGAAAGAATGAGIGALGGPVGALAGGAIGAGAGAITGATTSPQDVNLGRPPWSNPEVRTPLDENRGGRRYSSRGGATSGRYASAGHGGSTVREAQQALSDRGFNTGGADGVMGPQTRNAVMEFQRNNNIAATGRLDGATLRALNVSDTGDTRSSAAQRSTTPRSDRDRAYMGGGAVGTGTGTTAGTAPATGGTGTGTATSGTTATGTTATGTAATGTAAGAPGRAGGTGTGSSIGTTTGGSSGGSYSSSPGASPTGTGSTGPGGTTGVGSGNQPGTGGTSNTSPR